MTKLNCNVCNCSNNKDNCCCRPNIDVDGTNACICTETCCASFTPKESGASNSCGYCNANSTLEVSCQAQNCVHNKSGKCHAGSINIKEGSNGTECSSFKSKN